MKTIGDLILESEDNRILKTIEITDKKIKLYARDLKKVISFDNKDKELKIIDTFKIKDANRLLKTTLQKVRDNILIKIKEECECEGTGEIECNECDGTGIQYCDCCGREHDCDFCDGSGIVECESCYLDDDNNYESIYYEEIIQLNQGILFFNE